MKDLIPLPQLVRMVAHLQGVTVEHGQWNCVLKIIEELKAGNAKVLRKGWLDNFKSKYEEQYPLDLTKTDNWSYSEGFLKLEFSPPKRGKITLTVSASRGQSFVTDGFEATIKLPEEFFQHIQSNIKGAFDRSLKNMYQDHLEEQERLWIKKKAKELLTSPRTPVV
jgi:hypothetical protein